MNANKNFHPYEKAQALPMVAIMIFAVIAMAALIIDGGSIMLNRRSAQAAADAGALAGARELCYSTGASPVQVARNYALMNGAASANAQLSGGLVNVTATIENDVFFAGIFNQNTLAASAEAAAGCFPPSGNNLIPVAWSCRPSLGDTAPFDPGLDCNMMALDWPNLLRPLVQGSVSTIRIPGNDGDFRLHQTGGNFNIVHTSTGRPPRQVYIIMDSISTNQETLCRENLQPSDPAFASALTCDLDGDGKIDIEGGGNRGWLDFDGGGGGASQLRGWIQHGTSFTVSPHTWIEGESGNKATLYDAMSAHRRGQVVWLPVYNAICDNRHPLTTPACMSAAHAPPRPPVPPGGDIDAGGSAPKFHVIAFNPFYITCVRDHPHDICPGFTRAQQMNPSIKHNIPAVEGFFLSNVERQLDIGRSCDVNMGNCVVSLVK